MADDDLRITLHDDDGASAAHGPPRRRRWWLVVVGVAVVAVVVVGVVAALIASQADEAEDERSADEAWWSGEDPWAGPSDSGVDLDRAEQLLEGVDVCEDFEPEPTPTVQADEVLLELVVVREGCVSTELEVVAAERADERLTQLRRQDEVVAADVVAPLGPDAVRDGSDPDRDSQWGLDRLRVDAIDDRWGDHDVSVAVIDSGVDTDHSDLRDASVWTSEVTADHGTHVAGIIAAASGNEQFGRGLASQADLLPVSRDDLQTVATEVLFSVMSGADVINLSQKELSGDQVSDQPSQASEVAVRKALSEGTVIVASAGNCGGDSFAENGCRMRSQVQYPAAYTGVITVAATDRDDRRASFSSSRPDVDIAAPGDDIYSTLPDEGFGSESGTSMATPFVSATVAYLRSVDPDASPFLIRSVLQSTAEELGGRRVSDDFGFGLVDPSAALDRIGAERPPTAPPEVAAGTSTSLIMDISTSMDESTADGDVKLDAARGAATDIVETLRSEASLPQAGPQEASVVGFSTDAELYHASSEDLDSVRETVDDLVTVGDTNIGAGLQLAYQELIDRRAEDRRLAILLSDGETNTGMAADEILSRLVPDFADAGIPVYAIGFGQPGSYDEDLLRQIAEGTGGTYSYAETGRALQEAFIRARHESTGEVVAETEGTAGGGATAEAASFEVTGDEGLVNISLVAESTGLDLVVVDPLGRPYDASARNIDISEADGLSTAFITSPLPGEWHLQVRDRAAAGSATPYFAIVSVRERGNQAPAPVSGQARVVAIGFLALIALLGIIGSAWAWRAATVATTPARSPRGGRRDG